MNLADEFRGIKKNIEETEVTEVELKNQIERAIAIMKKARPFLKTWFENSPPTMGFGAKETMESIDSFITEME